MRKKLVFIIFICLVFFLAKGSMVNSITCLPPGQVITGTPAAGSGVRCATCDVCGYCLNQTPPQNWESCRNCLYPALTTFPALENKTLEVDPAIGLAPTTAIGSAYTMLGCINTGGFNSPTGTGAGGVAKALLNIVFSTVGGVALLYLIYGAFIILTSQANPERLSYGKNVVWGAVVGLIFSLSSVFIINLIASGVLKIPGFNAVSPTP